MQTYLYPFFIALGIFLAIDFVWLSLAGRAFYLPELGPLLRENPNLGVALGFYALFVAGLTFFVIVPCATSSLITTAAMAGFFGLVCYATYDLTNLATINGFTWRVAVVDMIWGTLLSAFVATATRLILRWFEI